MSFNECWSEMACVIDPAIRLPRSPFVHQHTVHIAQYERLLGTDFVPVLEGLADAHMDDGFTLTVIEPEPAYYRTHYSYFPALRFERRTLQERFWSALAYEPQGDPTGAIAYTADVVAVVGATRRWAVWGQRSWDLVLVQTDEPAGPWLDAGVPFVTARVALRDFTMPSRPSVPLPEDQVALFLENFDDQV
jgi:hypothetical protein